MVDCFEFSPPAPHLALLHVKVELFDDSFWLGEMTVDLHVLELRNHRAAERRRHLEVSVWLRLLEGLLSFDLLLQDL